MVSSIVFPFTRHSDACASCITRICVVSLGFLVRRQFRRFPESNFRVPPQGFISLSLPDFALHLSTSTIFPDDWRPVSLAELRERTRFLWVRLGEEKTCCIFTSRQFSLFRHLIPPDGGRQPCLSPHSFPSNSIRTCMGAASSLARDHCCLGAGCRPAFHWTTESTA
jgi:hypothetical protein